jgi:hypothetical protein
VVARSADQGATWSAPVRVRADNWQFEGCPHAGPSLQVDSLDRVHIAWWTGKEGEAGAWYARSDDSGRTFTTVVPLGIASLSRPAHVQLALTPDGKVVAVWDDGTEEHPRVVMRVSRNGGAHWSSAVPVSEVARAASFPVLAATLGGITIAWSERSIASAEREARSAPDMSDPRARMGLKAVGDAEVRVRRGVLR